MLTLILGGARSGKSRRALEVARRASPTSVIFMATAQRRDDEMRDRIARHRRERPASWTTIEESRRVPERLASLKPRATVVLDCVTLWVARLVTDRATDALILAAADQVADAVKARRLNLIAVSNEVGSGVVPPSRLGRRFQDVLGAVNARLARHATRVELMVAGLPLRVKGR